MKRLLKRATFFFSYLPHKTKKGPPEGEPQTLYRYNYFTITTRLVLLAGKMFSVEPTPFQVN